MKDLLGMLTAGILVVILGIAGFVSMIISSCISVVLWAAHIALCFITAPFNRQ
jgi:hypothetical protein